MRDEAAVRREAASGGAERHLAEEVGVEGEREGVGELWWCFFSLFFFV